MIDYFLLLSGYIYGVLKTRDFSDMEITYLITNSGLEFRIDKLW